MQNVKARTRAETPPKKRPRHYSYDESVDEPGKLLEQEAVEIEKKFPRKTPNRSKESNPKTVMWLR